MTSIHDVDLDTYCGRVGNLYGRYGLCPPFALRRIAADWKASGIALSHIVAVIDRHLTDHRNRYNGGSGDALFSWLDEFIRKTWYEQNVAPSEAKPSRPTMQRIVDPERSSTNQQAPVRDRAIAAGYGRDDHATSQSAKSIGKERRGPNRIDQAIAFLLRELANGEVAAALLEEGLKQAAFRCEH
jgi:hypothetical protein